MHLFPAQLPDRAVRIEQGDGRDNLLHFSAVGARVHHDGAAHAAGDACRKFHTAKAVAVSCARRFSERNTGTGSHAVSFHRQGEKAALLFRFCAVFLPVCRIRMILPAVFIRLQVRVRPGLSLHVAERQNHAAVSRVGDKQIAAAADQLPGLAGLLQEQHHFSQRPRVLRAHEKIRRPAHTEGGVQGHRLIRPHAVRAGQSDYFIAQLLIHLVLRKNSQSSSSSRRRIRDC